MSNETPSQENSARPVTEGQQVAKDVQTVIGHLRSGRTTNNEAVEVREAAERALKDKAIARAVYKEAPYR